MTVWADKGGAPAAVAGLLVLAGVACTGGTASAQVIDNYFRPLGSAVGGAPADASQGQAQSRFDSAGVRVGSFLVRTDVAESLGYDTNAQGSSPGRGSPFLNTAGNLAATSDWSRNSVYVNASVNNQRYLELPGQNYTQWQAEAGGTLDIGRDRAGLSYRHQNVPLTPGSLNAVTVTQPVTSRVDALALSYTLMSNGRLSFVPEIDVTRYDNDDFMVNGTTYSQAYRNRVAFQGGVTTRYELVTDVNLLLVTQASHVSYTGSVYGLPRRDSNGGSVLGGIDYSPPGTNLRFRALAGVQDRSYVKSAYSSQVAPTAEVSVTWTPTRLTTVSLTARRDIEDASDESIAGYTYSSVRLDVTHELRRNIILRAHGSLDQGDFQSASIPAPQLGNILQEAGTTQTVLNAGGSATWLLNRRLRLQLSDEVFKRQGGGSSYFANISLLTIGLRL